MPRETVFEISSNDRSVVAETFADEILVLDDREDDFVEIVDDDCVDPRRLPSSLTVQQVIEIYEFRSLGRAGRMGNALAKHLGVRARVVRDIWRDRTWTHITQKLSSPAVADKDQTLNCASTTWYRAMVLQDTRGGGQMPPPARPRAPSRGINRGSRRPPTIAAPPPQLPAGWP
eukprot:CAMPEP_0113704164 /NCGR_PEP_ID=MMETSP0038_2-20120614/26350_1 /TAXON_ID=2898 /ORGANISM="Cryptomonas paramecium" /LENGTH=173 /DNA_ID=CAMNT_0000628881 /DNA_START=341 /DNA_END=858 /DNA_ORIENTATION=- /assembly_acc=CAM_ASM_000170